MYSDDSLIARVVVLNYDSPRGCKVIEEYDSKYPLRQYIVLPMLATMRIILLGQMVTLTQKCQTGNGALLPAIL